MLSNEDMKGFLSHKIYFIFQAIVLYGHSPDSPNVAGYDFYVLWHILIYAFVMYFLTDKHCVVPDSLFWWSWPEITPYRRWSPLLFGVSYGLQCPSIQWNLQTPHTYKSNAGDVYTCTLSYIFHRLYLNHNTRVRWYKLSLTKVHTQLKHCMVWNTHSFLMCLVVVEQIHSARILMRYWYKVEIFLQNFCLMSALLDVVWRYRWFHLLKFLHSACDICCQCIWRWFWNKTCIDGK